MIIFFIWCLFFSFYFLFLSKKGWLLYILFCDFTLGWWIIVFFIIYYFGLIQFGSVFDFLSFLSQVFSLSLLAFVWLFFLDIILSYFGSEILNFIKIQFWLCICMCLSTIKIKPPKMNMYRQYFYFYFSLICYLIITSKLKKMNI